MIFFQPRKSKRVKKAEKAEALKKDILSKMEEASRLIDKTTETLSDPTLQIYYATRKKGKK